MVENLIIEDPTQITTKPHKFSDFADKNDDIYAKGPKVKIDDILGKEVTVLNFELKPSRFADNDGNAKKYTFIELEINGEKKVIMTAAKFLTGQLEKYKDQIPFVSSIYKTTKNSYAFK